MALSNTRWKRVAESRFPHEREALEFLSQNLPDSDPSLLYTNFEFIADDGSVSRMSSIAATAAIWTDTILTHGSRKWLSGLPPGPVKPLRRNLICVHVLSSDEGQYISSEYSAQPL
jgi:hypothetical protein